MHATAPALNAQLTIVDARIVGEPELRAYGDGGKRLFRARLMIPGIGTRGGAGFLDVAVFDGAEEIAGRVGKNSRVAFSGQLRWREWTTDDGGKRQALSATGTLIPLDQPQAAPTAVPAAAEPQAIPPAAAA